MVVPAPGWMTRTNKKTKAVGIPVIDLSKDRAALSELVVKACEEFGIFKVVNHGVPKETMSRLEEEGVEFFSKTASEKQRAGPANPFGYGCKNIGLNGDRGELEYIILQTNPLSIAERSKTISNDPTKFSCAVNDYIQAVRGLACQILRLVAAGLWVPDEAVFSSLITDVHSDSVLRLNHYPNSRDPSSNFDPNINSTHIGFGEHSDPQILTILRSNEVGGLQISLRDGLWVPVPPDPNNFYVLVGDAFQALTNGKFTSVRHRAMAYCSSSSAKSRMSTMYFGAPPLNATIAPPPDLVSPEKPSLYRPFSWGEFKKAAYSLRLGDRRLDLFKVNTNGTGDKNSVTPGGQCKP